MSTPDAPAFRIQPSGDGRTFVLTGELDMAAADQVAQATVGVDGDGDVVFDLGGLAFIDSSGLRAVLRVAERIGGGTLILRSPSDPVRRVLDIVGLTDATSRIVIEG